MCRAGKYTSTSLETSVISTSSNLSVSSSFWFESLSLFVDERLLGEVTSVVEVPLCIDPRIGVVRSAARINKKLINEHIRCRRLSWT